MFGAYHGTQLFLVLLTRFVSLVAAGHDAGLDIGLGLKICWW